MKLEFLLEIGCEEIPATFLHSMALKLEQGITNTLRNNAIGLEYSHRYYTPRRLTIHLKGVEEKQPARQATITGPPYKIAKVSLARRLKGLPVRIILILAPYQKLIQIRVFILVSRGISLVILLNQFY